MQLCAVSESGTEAEVSGGGVLAVARGGSAGRSGPLGKISGFVRSESDQAGNKDDKG